MSSAYALFVHEDCGHAPSEPTLLEVWLDVDNATRRMRVLNLAVQHLPDNEAVFAAMCANDSEDDDVRRAVMMQQFHDRKAAVVAALHPLGVTHCDYMSARPIFLLETVPLR